VIPMEQFFNPFAKKDSKSKKKDNAKTKKSADVKKRASAIPAAFEVRQARMPPSKRASSDEDSESSEGKGYKRKPSESEESEYSPPPPPKKRTKKKKKKKRSYREVVPSSSKISVFFDSRWFVRQLKKDKKIGRDVMEAMAIYQPEDFQRLKNLDQNEWRRLKYGVLDAYGPKEQYVDFSEDGEEDEEDLRHRQLVDLSGKGGKVRKSQGAVASMYVMSAEQLAHYHPFFADVHLEHIGKSLSNSNGEWIQTLVAKFLNFALHYFVYSDGDVPFHFETLFERTTGYGLDGFVKTFRRILFFALIAYRAAKNLVSKAPGSKPRNLCSGKGAEEVSKRIRSVLQQPNYVEEMPEQLFHKLFPQFKKKSGFWLARTEEESNESDEEMLVVEEVEENKKTKAKAKSKAKAKPKPKVKEKKKKKEAPEKRPRRTTRNRSTN